MQRCVIASCVVVIACTRGEQPRMQSADTITQRQHDSVIGASGLPGAQGIAKAQAAQDSAAARAARLDSIQ